MTAPTPPPDVPAPSLAGVEAPPPPPGPPAPRHATAPAPEPEAPRDLRPSSLASEAGLLLLSLVLALMVWLLVRELVNDVKPANPRVQPVAPPGWRAAAYEPVEINLRGPRGEVEEALGRLKDRNNTVRLLLADLGGNERTFGPQDRYQFPFHERLLERTPPPPPGEMWRLEVDKPVRVLTPALESPPPAGVRVRVEVPADPIRVTAPFRALGDTIEPDPIDVKPLLDVPSRPLGTAVRVPLRFERWRRGEGGAGGTGGAGGVPATILRRRVDVVLEGVEALVHFEVSTSDLLAHALEVVVKRGYEVREISPTTGGNAFTGALSVSAQNPRLEVTFTGKVTATPEALKDLVEHKDEWRWTLVVSDADLPDQGQSAAEVTARLLFVPLSERFRELHRQGVIAFETLSVPVQVVGTR